MEQQGVPQITPSISSLDWINMTLSRPIYLLNKLNK